MPNLRCYDPLLEFQPGCRVAPVIPVGVNGIRDSSEATNVCWVTDMIQSQWSQYNIAPKAANPTISNWSCSNGIRQEAPFRHLYFCKSSISLQSSLKKILSLVILWNSAFRWIYLSFSLLSFTSLIFSAICKAFSNSHFAFPFLGEKKLKQQCLKTDYIFHRKCCFYEILSTTCHTTSHQFSSVKIPSITVMETWYIH